jgi:hypothetical protein
VQKNKTSSDLREYVQNLETRICGLEKAMRRAIHLIDLGRADSIEIAHLLEQALSPANKNYVELFNEHSR